MYFIRGVLDLCLNFPQKLFSISLANALNPGFFFDSVVYTSRPDEWKPELGDYLGDLTDEVLYNRIIEFVTGGPKNYPYKIARTIRMEIRPYVK
jgi:hypothetical protein